MTKEMRTAIRQFRRLQRTIDKLEKAPQYPEVGIALARLRHELSLLEEEHEVLRRD